MLQKFGMVESKPVKTPLLKDEEKGEEAIDKLYPYREVLGSLLYLSSKTRPDLAFATGYCSRYTENLTKGKVVNLKRVLRYTNSTLSEGLKYMTTNNEEVIDAYSDSDFAGDPLDRKSTTGYIIMYAGGPISWCSRKQSIVAQLTTEAEYVAAAECCMELLEIRALIKQLTGNEVRLNLNVDNQSAIKLIKNGVTNKRSKHIDIKFHLVHDTAKAKILNITYCSIENQIADICTKALCHVKFNKFKAELVSYKCWSNTTLRESVRV